MTRRVMELDWEGRGYHGFPVPQGPGGYPSAEEAMAWAGFERVLASAKCGDVSRAGQLLSIYDGAGWLLCGASADLLGDIGSRTLFDSLRSVVSSVAEPTYSVDLGCSLAAWGHLSVVPTLVDTLVKVAEFIDAPALVHALSLLLEAEPGELADPRGLRDVEAYALTALRRRDDVEARLGTVDAPVLFGELFSVDSLVEVMRRRLTGGLFDPALRHRFEATTGVDCSAFYERGILQPQRAVALLDGFEESDGCERFVPGRRYFFGHLLPDAGTDPVS